MNDVLNKYIDEIKDKIINSTCEIINIPSVFDNTDSNTPFGIHTVEALNYMLNLGKSFGFRTKNIDNKCGYIEFGEGDKLLGIVAHLDVVPADEGWNFSPFNSTIYNNNIYGRGAIDDKGPAVAALYAMKSVSDNYDITDKRIRLILGLDEEISWKCIERYKQTEELPDISFSPDANFPCVYAEKTIESIYLKQKYIKNPTLYIEDISTNNNAINVVPKYCSVTLGYDKSKISNIISDIENILDKYKYNINIEEIDASHIKLISLGTPAHAAHPELGVNAISKLLIILNEIFNLYNINLSILEYFAKYIGDDYTGKNLKINYTDEFGILTLNTAQFTLENNYLSIGFNLRIPVTINYNNIEKEFKKYCNNDLEILVTKIQEPLCFEKSHPLVQKLCDIFNEYNNSNAEPQTMGGGTYARALKNCISFGPQMPGAKDMCHQTDEFISIENLMFCTKVYAQAILDL